MRRSAQILLVLAYLIGAAALPAAAAEGETLEQAPASVDDLPVVALSEIKGQDLFDQLLPFGVGDQVQPASVSEANALFRAYRDVPLAAPEATGLVHAVRLVNNTSRREWALYGYGVVSADVYLTLLDRRGAAPPQRQRFGALYADKPGGPANVASFDLAPGAEYVLYVWRTSQIGKMVVKVDDTAVILDEARFNTVVIWILVGMCAALAIYNLLNYFGTFDSVYVYYSLIVLMVMLVYPQGDGFWYYFLPSPLWAVVGVLWIPAISFTLIFVTRILRVAVRWPRFARYVERYAWAWFLVNIPIMLDPYGFVSLISLHSLITTTYFVVLCILAVRAGDKVAPYILVAWISNFLTGILNNFNALGLVDGLAINTVAFSFAGNVVYDLLLAFALAARIRLVVKENMELNRNLEEKVARRTLQVEKARARAEDATRAKSMFLASMSHELRTPMNGVMSMADLLGDTKLSGEQSELVRVIKSSSSSLLNIINDILDFSKIEAGQLTLEKINVNLALEAEAVLQLLADVAHDKELDLFMTVDGGLETNRIGDPLRLRQILINLVGNGIKFTEKGHVAIMIGEGAKGYVRLQVEDTGIGITKDQQAKLFQAFQQADTSVTRKFGGTGLGLTICRRLVELMGGSMGVDSMPGKGSAFWVELPLPRSEEPATLAERLDGQKILFLANSGAPGNATRNILERLGAEMVAQPWEADLAVIDVSAHMVSEGLSWATQKAAALDLPCAVLVPRSLVKPEAAPNVTMLTKPLLLESFVDNLMCSLGMRDMPTLAAAEVSRFPAFILRSRDEADQAGTTILVAEDNPTNQLIIAKILNGFGLVHDLAEDGIEALEAFKSNRYGMIISDFHMPRMNGLTLSRKVRALEAAQARPVTPIIALTADALPGTVQLCQDAGMNACLTKPINRELLAETIAAMLPRALKADMVFAPQNSTPGEEDGAGDGEDDFFAPEPPNEIGENDTDATDEADIALDTAYLFEAVGGDEALVATVLESLTCRADAMVDAIRTAAALGDANAVFHAAHALAGAANTVGAISLAAEVEDIERAARDGNLPSREKLVRLDGLKDSFLQAADALVGTNN